MTQLFTLRLTDGVNTVDFLDGINFALEEGGFNIGLPGDLMEPLPYRSGPFFIPATDVFKPRLATIKFQVIGAGRDEIAQKLAKIRRILRRAESRWRFGAGGRVELQYSWQGTSQITYFEVYCGLVSPSEDVMSVEKMHYQLEGKYRLPGCTLEMYLSTYGYGVSPINGSPIEVPLYNPTVGSKQTGGIIAINPKNEPGGVMHYNYVEIDGSDLQGSEPYLTVVHIQGGTSIVLNKLFIGHRVEPFPSQNILIYENDDLLLLDWTDEEDTAASGKTSPTTYGRLLNFEIENSGVYSTYSNGYPFFCWSWNANNPSGNGPVGMFYTFLAAGYPLSENFQFANHWMYGISDFVPIIIGQRFVPLGPIQLPRGYSRDLANAGNILNFAFGVDIAANNPGFYTFYCDYLYLLPIDNGLRIIDTILTENFAAQQYWDDAWQGLLYGKVVGPGLNHFLGVNGVLEPIKLEPGVTQRLYFYWYSPVANLSVNETYATIRVYVVPTYLALAT